MLSATTLKLRSCLYALALCALLAPQATGHHGWDGYSDDEVVLRGTVDAFQIGNPHSELRLRVDDKLWNVTLGPPWRNRRAGLAPALLRRGAVVSIYGRSPTGGGERQLKATRLTIEGRNYDLYPKGVY